MTAQENANAIEIYRETYKYEIASYIRDYENFLRTDDKEVSIKNAQYNWLSNSMHNSAMLPTLVKLVQAEKAGVIGDAAWRFNMSWAPKAIYEALKS